MTTTDYTPAETGDVSWLVALDIDGTTLHEDSHRPGARSTSASPRYDTSYVLRRGCVPAAVGEVDEASAGFGERFEACDGPARGPEAVEESCVRLLVVLPLPSEVVFIEDGLDRARRFTCTAIDALVGVDVERTTALVDGGLA